MQTRRTFMLFGLAASERSWRGLRLLLGVYLGSLLFAAVLSPWVYHLVQTWHESMPGKLNSYLAYKGFEDYFDRLRWVPILALLPWVLAKCRLWSLKRLGMSFDREGRRFLKRGFLLGMGLMLVVIAAQVVTSPTVLKEGLNAFVVSGIVFRALIGGVLLGLLEETVFRGLILRLFYTAGGPVTAVIIGSLFFAYAHFKMPDHVWQEAFPTEISSAEAEVYALEYGQPPPEDLKRVKAWSGFYVAGWTLVGIAEDFRLVPFLNLFMLGVVLSLLTLQAESLMPAVGLHAGVVFGMLGYRKLADIASESLWWGSSGLVDGLLPLLLLTVLAVVVWALPLRESARHHGY